MRDLSNQTTFATVGHLNAGLRGQRSHYCKVESGVKYVGRNFLCGLQGREPSCLSDLNAQLRAWVWEVVNQRVHGTTHEQVQQSILFLALQQTVRQVAMRALP